MSIEKIYKLKMKNRVKQLVVINDKKSLFNANKLQILNSICNMYNKEIKEKLAGLEFHDYLNRGKQLEMDLFQYGKKRKHAQNK